MKKNQNKDIDLATAMLYLQDIGVKIIIVEYSGGGDSGGIDSLSYYSDLNEEQDIEVENNDILNLIEKAAYDKLNNPDIEDWYNNDGGWGIIKIYVPSGDYEIENNIRIIDSECYEHYGNLTEE